MKQRHRMDLRDQGNQKAISTRRLIKSLDPMMVSFGRGIPPLSSGGHQHLLMTILRGKTQSEPRFGREQVYCVIMVRPLDAERSSTKCMLGSPHSSSPQP